MNNIDITTIVEVSHSPDDCFLNHKVRKVSLRRLLVLGLIEVETRRMTPWYTGSISDHRSRHGQHWRDRTEIHARLTPLGHEWVTEYKASGVQFEV